MTILKEQREGFSLMVTLSVLTVVIALTAVLLSYFDQTRRHAQLDMALIESNLLYADIASQLKKLKGSHVNQLYSRPLAFSDPKSGIALSLVCEPKNSGININWLAYENDPKHQRLYQEAQKLYDFLVIKYRLREPEALLEMIRSQIKSSSTFLKNPQSRLRQKNGIISSLQYGQIVKLYEQQFGDRRAAKVPWQRYFSFAPESKVIEIGYASNELISYLFDIDLRSVKIYRALPPEERVPLRQFVEDSGGDYESLQFMFSDKKSRKIARCNVRFSHLQEQYRFSFEYDGGDTKFVRFYGS